MGRPLKYQQLEWTLMKNKHSLIALYWMVILASIQSTSALAQEALATDETPDTSLTEEQLNPEQQEYINWASGIWEALDRQKGEVKIPSANVSFTVPDNFYFLNPNDAEKVLVEVWGNPPGNAVLGMLFPEEFTPFDENAWAVTVQYEADGYVSDDDAADIDYSDLLKDMKADTREASKQRVAQGYETIELVGWAAEPFYNQQTHKMHWAKEIKFGADTNTLNYNVRALGRRGVLILNFIADIDQKELIAANLDTVMAMAEFDQGARYDDFEPGVDKVAAYGLGALVAGKVLAKTGLLAALLIFLKKFGVFIVIGLAALLRKFFRKKPSVSDE